MKKIVGFTLILFLFTSCEDHPFKAELSELDTLNHQLDSIQEVFKTIDLEKAVANNVRVQKDANELKMYVENYPEAFDNKLGVLIDELRIAKKVYSNIEKNHSKVEKEISYSKTQLNDLKKDLKSNNLMLEKGKDFFNKEKKAVKELIKNVSMMKQNEKIGVVKYEAQLELIEDYKKRQN